MWNILKIIHDGLSEESFSKVDQLINFLELFCMKNGETIGKLQNQSTQIVNKLNYLQYLKS